MGTFLWATMYLPSVTQQAVALRATRQGGAHASSLAREERSASSSCPVYLLAIGVSYATGAAKHGAGDTLKPYELDEFGAARSL